MRTETLHRLACWIPLVGPVVEVSRSDRYLADSSHQFRYTASAVYHGVMIFLALLLAACWVYGN